MVVCGSPEAAQGELDGGDNGAVLREVLTEEQPPSHGPRAAQGEGERLRAKCPFSIFLKQPKGLLMQEPSRGLLPSLLKVKIQLP